LEFIWWVIQDQKSGQHIPKLNPEQVRNKGILSNDVWAILCKIFWHDSSKYLSSHVLKVEVKDLVELLLSSQIVRVIAFTRFMPPGYTCCFLVLQLANLLDYLVNQLNWGLL